MSTSKKHHLHCAKNFVFLVSTQEMKTMQKNHNLELSEVKNPVAPCAQTIFWQNLHKNSLFCTGLRKRIKAGCTITDTSLTHDYHSANSKSMRCQHHQFCKIWEPSVFSMVLFSQPPVSLNEQNNLVHKITKVPFPSALHPFMIMQNHRLNESVIVATPMSGWCV